MLKRYSAERSRRGRIVSTDKPKPKFRVGQVVAHKELIPGKPHFFRIEGLMRCGNISYQDEYQKRNGYFGYDADSLRELTKREKGDRR